MGEERKNVDISVHDYLPRRYLAYGYENADEMQALQIDNIDGHPVGVQCPLFLLTILDRVNSTSPSLFIVFWLYWLEMLVYKVWKRILGMHGNQYNIALFIFFIPYIPSKFPQIFSLRSSNTRIGFLSLCSSGEFPQYPRSFFRGLLVELLFDLQKVFVYPNLFKLKIVSSPAVFASCPCTASAGNSNNELYGFSRRQSLPVRSVVFLHMPS